MAGPFELQVRKFAENAMEDADQVVRKVVLDIYGALILRSPVDTGRFRANWLYGEGRQQYRTVKGSGTTLAPMPAPEFPGFTGSALGKIHHLSNMVEYGPVLERGSSKQAPLGIVGLTAMEFNSYVRRATDGLGYGYDEG